jgi:hypothetical protein
MGINLGGFAGGLAKGYEFGSAIKDKREKKSKEDQILEASKNAIKAFDDQNMPSQNASITKPQNAFDMAGLQTINSLPTLDENTQPTANAGDINTQPEQNADFQNKDRLQAQVFKDGGMVRKYAEGGLASLDPTAQQPTQQPAQQSQPLAFDPNSSVNQVNQSVQQPAQQAGQQGAQVAPPVNKQALFAKRTIAGIDAARDKALELGDFNTALSMQKQGFEVRGQLFKDGLATAQRQFDVSGKLDGFINIYNDAIGDGGTVKGYKQNPDGSYAIELDDGTGNSTQRQFTPDQIKQLVYSYQDPAARWKAEMASLQKLAEQTNESNLKIKEEKAKPRTLNQGEVLVDGDGKQLANNPAAPKSLSEIEFYQKDPEGYKKWKASGREGRAPTEYEQWQRDPKGFAKFKSEIKGDGGGGDGLGKELPPNEQQESVSVASARRFIASAGTPDEIREKVKPKIYDSYGAATDNPKFDPRLAEQYKLSMQPDPQHVRIYGTDPYLERYTKGLPKYKETPLPPPQVRQVDKTYELPNGTFVKWDGKGLKPVNKGDK